MADRRRALSGAFATLFLLAGAPLGASEGPAEPPDLSGFWGPVFEIGEAPADWVEALPPDTALLADTGMAEFPKGEFGGLRPRADALARAERWQAEDDMTLARVCLPPSLIYAIQGPFPFEIHQTPTLIVMRYEYFDQVRLIFMDGRAVPDDIPLSKTGYSTGRWEGRELVIETTRIAPATITNNGLDHSDRIRMTERYRLSPDGSRLEAMQWFADPVALENNGARYLVWENRPGQHVYPYECDPSFALEYAQVEDGAEDAAR